MSLFRNANKKGTYPIRYVPFLFLTKHIFVHPQGFEPFILYSENQSNILCKTL